MDSKEGYLLILITTSVLFAFVVSFLIIMLIYRKRKIEHIKEMEIMNEKFARELLQTQLEVQQQTMQHIGREIHDSVGQKLTLASLYAQQIDYEKKHPQIGERIVAVSNIINESLSELRSLSKSLTSDYIADTDLITLIENECKKTAAAAVCKVNFNTAVRDVKTTYSVRNITIRIVQEALQNSLKHARCSAIDTCIAVRNEGLEIIITDDGIGFSGEEAAGKGIGLTTIQKRAEAIGATATVASSTGQGTSITLYIPCNHNE